MSAIPECLINLPTQTFESGAEILEQDSVSEKLYFLKSGSVEIVKNGVRIVEVSQVGAVFGELSVLLKTPHTATVKALESSTFYVADDPAELIESNPVLSLYVAQILAKRLNALNKYLLDVKAQFEGQSGHLSMVDDVLGTLMNKHPRDVDRRRRTDL